MTENEAKWAERVRGWRASGKTAADYAAGRGYEGSTLRYWASQLRRRVPAIAAAPTNSVGPLPAATAAPRPKQSPRPAARPAAAPRMLRVTRVTPPRISSDALVVGVGAARIEVQSGFDRALLRDIVDTLGGGR
jgi:hypothetical protein